jgi:hypothetical protein
MVLAGMVMLKRNWMTDRVALEKTFGTMKERKWPVCMSLLAANAGLITFAEGTRIKPTTRAGVVHMAVNSRVKSFRERRACQYSIMCLFPVRKASMHVSQPFEEVTFATSMVHSFAVIYCRPYNCILPHDDKTADDAADILFENHQPLLQIPHPRSQV